jgi:hypothetical protein
MPLFHHKTTLMQSVYFPLRPLSLYAPIIPLGARPKKRDSVYEDCLAPVIDQNLEMCFDEKNICEGGKGGR